MSELATRWSQNDKVLFIGDSITDCGRRSCPQGLGSGYVSLINNVVTIAAPQLNIEIVNRGISGNTSRDLVRRWESDVIAEAPDWLYIMIGINDVWRQLENRHEEAVLVDEFEENYRTMLETTLEKLPNCRIRPMEATVHGEDLTSEGNALLTPYLEVIHRLADKYGLTVVPTNQVFRQSIQTRPSLKLTTDGVHPNAYGHALLALTILGTSGLTV